MTRRRRDFWVVGSKILVNRDGYLSISVDRYVPVILCYKLEILHIVALIVMRGAFQLLCRENAVLDYQSANYA